MTLHTQQPIDLSQIAPFLVHPGARLGVHTDPPGPSFSVEGGLFLGFLYAGLVHTPTIPASGSTRVDLVIANPSASGGAVIEVIAGVDDDPSPPDLAEYPGAAPIAEITVTGNSGGRVVIQRSDILDLRPTLSVPGSPYQMLFHGRLVLGGDMPSVGSTQLMGQNVLNTLPELSSIYPYPEVLVVKATKNSNRVGANGTVAWVDLELPYYVDEFHLSITPYDTTLRAGSSGAVNGFSVKDLASVTLDSEGRGLPMIRVGVAAAGSLFPDRRFSNMKHTRKRRAYADFQAWGRLA